jgi:hypothetical protein
MPESKPEPKSEPKSDSKLADAASASDPAVHQLLADRQTAEMNGDKDAAEAATAELKKLGYK